MKLITFQKENSQEIGGVLEETLIVPLQGNYQEQNGQASAYFADMLSFLKGGEAAKHTAEEVLRKASIHISASEVRLLSPVPRPESIRDCLAFEQHIINCIRKVGLKKLAPLDEKLEKLFGRKRSLAGAMNKAWYERPVYYKGNRFSVVGDRALIKQPSYTQELDYELEWGIFIGKQGKGITVEDAHEYIGGYTVFNDFSARDIQMSEQAARLGPAKGKDFDTGNAIGPFLVTPDEITDPYQLEMTATVNGEVWSKGNTGDMYWTFEQIISYISMSETLYPGEFIGSGTCSGKDGCGCGLEMGKFLKAGDTVVLEVEGVGCLCNTVAE